MRKNQLITFLFLLIIVLPCLASAEEYFAKDLRLGLLRNKEVTKLQNFLRDLGYFKYKSTGNFFTSTASALKKFQRDYKLPVTGTFGSQTRSVSNLLVSQRNVGKPNVQTEPNPVLYAATFKEKIAIADASGSGDDPLYEYVTVENRTQGENINVSGFKILNGRNEAFIIPKGLVLPGIYTKADDPIILKPGGRVTVTVGKQERSMNFQTNLCTGFFDESSEFYPSLNHQCPLPDTSDREYRGLSDRCMEYLETLSSCRAPDYTQIYENDCSEYASRYYTYAGCVQNFRNQPDFFSGEWLVWMQRDKKFFRSKTDTIILKDPFNREVDRREY